MKREFFEYIGNENSLASYSRSYKLVFLKSLFATMDTTGKSSTYQVAEQFKAFYEARKKAGKMPDANVDTRIENVERSSISSVLSVILDNPYKVIAGKKFVRQKNFDGTDYFVLSPELVSELTQEDLNNLNITVDKKIQLYFSRIDGNTKAVDMQSLFNQMLESYFDCRTSQAFAGNATGELFRKKAPVILEKVPTFDNDTYLIKGSIGQGNWATVPWICIFDKRITTTAQHGVYIVYLLSEDGKTLYLTLNQGCTNYKNTLGKKGAIQKMQQIALDIRLQIKTERFIDKNDFVLGNEFYEQGCIFYKKYSKGNVPHNEELIADFEEMLRIYKQYYNIAAANKSSSVEEVAGEKEKSKTMEDYIVSDELTRIAEFIALNGFSYEENLIENFYLSLKAKPFVILAGTSGTGKTKLVKLFAEAIGATTANGRYKLVPVHPDWSDSTDLFGHVDLNGHYIPGVLNGFIKSAMADLDKPYFLCLDEMNLARVEYYFSDVLSVIETRRVENGKAITDPLIATEIFGDDKEAKAEYENLYLPENLYIVGTVNMDETTFPFSKKVLDRANTIEFSFVNLDAINTIGKAEVSVLDNDFLKGEYLLLGECNEYEDIILSTVSLLKQINQVLTAANAQIGYRVRDEICFYVIYNAKYLLMDNNVALDFSILQKILPRIQGSSISIKNMLLELFKTCTGNFDELFQSSDNSASDIMFDYLNKQENVPYRRSAEKIAFMTRRFEEDGYTSYWL